MKPEATLLQSLAGAASLSAIFRLLEAHGDTVALAADAVDGGTATTSYKALCAQVRVAAGNLSRRLPKAPVGSFIGLHFDNRPEWPVLFWAVLMAGHHPILLDFRAAQDVTGKLLEQVGAVLLISDTESNPTERVPLLKPSQLVGDDGEPLSIERWGNLVALCTSGTGGEPHVVVHDAESILAVVSKGAAAAELSPYFVTAEASVLAFVPFFHVLGLMTLIWYTAMGKRVVFLPNRSPDAIGDTCRKHGVTLLYGVPLLWNRVAARIREEVERASAVRRCLFGAMCFLSVVIQRLWGVAGQRFVQKRLLGRLHRQLLGPQICLVSAGAPLPLETTRLLTRVGFPLLSGFGMTEAGVVSVDLGTQLGPRLRGSCGPLLPGVEAKVEADTGELLLRGPTLFAYEFRAGQLTRPARDDGWMRTGDLARFVDNELFIVGRSKDTIVTESGENVQPERVESCIGSLVETEATAIVGLSQSGHPGEQVVLAVYDGGASSAGARAQWVQQVRAANRRLAVHERIDRVVVCLEAIPRTTTMKVMRRVLKEQLESGSLDYRELKLSSGALAEALQEGQRRELGGRASEGALAPADTAAVAQLIAAVLKAPLDRVQDSMDCKSDLGADSLKMLELAAALEKTYGVFLSDEVMRDVATVGDVKALVAGGSPPSGRREGPKSTALSPIRTIEEDPDFRMMSARLERAGALNPYFIAHDSAVRDHSTVAGTECLNLASYNYLGLSGDAAVTAATQAAVAQLGTSASGSRLLTGDKSLYRELEKELADWKGTEDALVLVSGHATNVTLIGNFCGPEDLILYDALSHNSVEQGCRLSRSDSRSFRHNDAAECGRILEAVRHRYRKVLLVIEGVYSMDGDVSPVLEFVKLKHKHGTFLLVDEAHSAGVLGRTGKGVDEHFSLSPGDIDLRMGTLSKALGSCGGYLAGSRNLIEYLRYTLPGFVFSVGISPANAAAALAGLRLLRAEPERVRRLHENIRTFVAEAQRLSFDTCGASESPIIPVLVGDEARAFELCARLRERGIFVAPAIYPSVPLGGARLRFCVTSLHKEAQLRWALEVLASCFDPSAVGEERQSGIPPLPPHQVVEQKVI